LEAKLSSAMPGTTCWTAGGSWRPGARSWSA